MVFVLTVPRCFNASRPRGHTTNAESRKQISKSNFVTLESLNQINDIKRGSECKREGLWRKSHVEALYKSSLSNQETGWGEWGGGRGGVLLPSSAIIATIDFTIFFYPKKKPHIR